MAYTLYIYDCDRCGYDVRHNPDPLTSVLANLEEKLRKEQLGPSVIFERLAMRLLQSFPFPQESTLWLNLDPLEAVRELQSGLWELGIADERADEFLKALLPLARALLLTVVDPQRGLLVQYQPSYSDSDRLLFPQSALADYHRLDSNVATDQFTQASLRQHIIERLTPALAEHGFKREIHKSYGFYFWRPFGDYRQSISGNIEGTSPDYEFRDVSIGGGGRHPLSIELKKLRMHAQPAWDSEDSRRYRLARNFEWVGWMVDDILAYGLPILDKGRTSEGVDWLYNAPEGLKIFPGNVYNSRPQQRDEDAIIVAMQVGNPHFEDIASRLLEMSKGKPEWFSSRVLKKIEFCRTLLNTPEAKQLSYYEITEKARTSP